MDLRIPNNKRLLILIAAIVPMMLSGCGDISGSSSGGRRAPQCSGTGLAGVDLSGNCRSAPHATMGALEAVGG
jgi:hypothetical protein